MRLNSREEWGAYEVPELTIKERKRRMNMLDKDERGMMNEEGDEQEDDEHIVEEGSDVGRGKRQGRGGGYGRGRVSNINQYGLLGLWDSRI